MLRSALLALLVLGLLPAAAAAADVTLSCAPACTVPAGTEVTFSATPEGTVVSYAWDLDEDGNYGARDGEPEGPSATEVRRTFPEPGRFLVAVRARDPRGTQAFARQLVTVEAATEPPVLPPLPGTLPAPPGAAGPLFPAPPGVGADDDGDGSPAGRDACPDSPAGRPARVGGCSVLDALIAPRAVIGLLGGPDTAQRLGLRGLPGGKAALRRLGGGIGDLRAAALDVPEGPCGASAEAGDALRDVRRGLNATDGALGRASKALGKAWGGTVGGGDAGVGDGRLAGLLMKRKRAHELAGDAARLRGLLAATCAADDGTKRIRGRVEAVSGDVAILTGGQKIAFGAADAIPGLAPGTAVQASGRALGAGLLVASKLQAVGVGLKPILEQCEFLLQVAPVQNFAVGNDEIVFDDARAFLWSGVQRFERGMRIGASRSGCTAKDDYALHVSLEWGPKNNPSSRYLGVLRGTLGFEPPLHVPDDVPAGVRLKVSLYGLDCETPKDITICDNGQLIYSRSDAAVVRPDGYYAQAKYNKKQFQVDDGSQTDFDIAQLKGLDAPKLPGASVFGVGYALQGDQSAYPQRSFILQGQSFAVHNHVPTQADPRGLYHAYANGFHDGYPYHFVARLPEIVTDGLPGCGFYRLPWKVGTLAKTTQGNNGDVTHSGGQKYAFDFRMGLFTVGRATRGGLVTLVVEDRSKTSNPGNVKAGLEEWLPGNLLLIRHQDGSTSFYTHMLKDGVFPEEGDYVERGDVVIVVGNTGNSSGAHLHYHVTSTGDTENDSYGGSIPIQFELFGVGGLSCGVPKKGSSYFSTNG